MSNTYESHQRAAEMHEAAAHAHLSAASSDHQDHLTGSELSRRALEHSQRAHFHTGQVQQHEHFTHAEIAVRAHELWQQRGGGHGSDREDWINAVRELRSRSNGL